MYNLRVGKQDLIEGKNKCDYLAERAYYHY